MNNEPSLLTFAKIGDPALGYISLIENPSLPFKIKRIYWTYFTPEEVQRGSHAHYQLEQILVALSGTIIVETEMPNGKKDKFILNSPDQGLYIPKYSWHVMKYTHNAVQMSMSSMVYDEQDYIRDYKEFLQLPS